ncbi:MAG: hypothetical protein LBU15_02470 [Rickettsiales bacterium]|jgi:hypothetical protein|nr:hypothetical protein [Rickettsiales bacterium]
MSNDKKLFLFVVLGALGFSVAPGLTARASKRKILQSAFKKSEKQKTENGGKRSKSENRKEDTDIVEKKKDSETDDSVKDFEGEIKNFKIRVKKKGKKSKPTRSLTRSLDGALEKASGEDELVKEEDELIKEEDEEKEKDEKEDGEEEIKEDDVEEAKVENEEEGSEEDSDTLNHTTIEISSSEAITVKIEADKTKPYIPEIKNPLPVSLAGTSGGGLFSNPFRLIKNCLFFGRKPRGAKGGKYEKKDPLSEDLEEEFAEDGVGGESSGETGETETAKERTLVDESGEETQKTQGGAFTGAASGAKTTTGVPVAAAVGATAAALVGGVAVGAKVDRNKTFFENAESFLTGFLGFFSSLANGALDVITGIKNVTNSVKNGGSDASQGDREQSSRKQSKSRSRGKPANPRREEI